MTEQTENEVETQAEARNGRPPYQPTDEQRRLVERLTGIGTPQMIIAQIVEMSDRSLRKHFRRELDLGAGKANAAVAQSLYNKALGNDTGSVSAAIFWLKSRAGWRDVNFHAHGGDDAAPPIRTETAVAITPAEAYRRMKDECGEE